jgi:sulfite reductase beta subunit-like hemoprotein
MSSSKNKNIVLGVIVIAVWGLIAFKILSYLKSTSIVELPITNVFKTAGIKVKREKFTIDASYRDPFLNEIEEKAAKQFKNRELDFQRSKPQIKWPEIKYNGIIETSSKDKKVGLLQVNKRVYLVNIGDSAARMTVIAMYKDSLRLKYSNEVKVYPLQK